MVRRQLEQAGLGLLHLPRDYSPDPSPIEPIWSTLEALRRAAAARTAAAPGAALAAVPAGVTAHDARGWFQHCGYAVPANRTALQPALDAYREAVRRGVPATVRGVAIDEEDRLRREVIEHLMCRFRVDLASVCRRYGWSPDRLAPELEALAPLAADGLVSVAGHEVRLLPEGRPLVRTVCAVFDTYLATGAGRHSRPI